MKLVNLAVLTLLGAVPAAAQTQVYTVTRGAPAAYKGYDEFHLSRAAVAGQEVRVWYAQMIEPDCSPHGSMTTQVVRQPGHGTIRVSDDAFFPSFPPGNVRAACDTRKAPGKQAFYTAEAGFHGRDRLVLQNSTSEGRIRKIVVDIDVR